MRSSAFTAQIPNVIEFQCTSFRDLLFAVLTGEVAHVVTADSAAQVREAVPVARGSSAWRINLNPVSFACVLHCR
jgi:hypothetical protein